MSRCLMSRRIDACLERSNADAANGLEEGFAVLALCHVHIEDALDGLGHFGLCNGRADHLADGRIAAARRAAQRDLVPLLATLIDAEDADVPDGVMTAAVHAARHL